MKKALAIILCVVVLSAVAVYGTVAYLMGSDSDVNVMELGNVAIDQIEQERGENGDLQDYTQDKLMLPAYYPGNSLPWAPARDWVVPGDQAWKTVEEGANALDKFVTVKNTGTNAAYVRTVFAFEVVDENDENIHVVYNAENVIDKPTYDWSYFGNDQGILVNIDGTNYWVMVATYEEALAPNAETIPSLKQVYLDKKADNADVAAYGESYEILVFTQAVQAQMGELTPSEALDEAFGKITVNNHPWING